MGVLFADLMAVLFLVVCKPRMFYLLATDTRDKSVIKQIHMKAAEDAFSKLVHGDVHAIEQCAFPLTF